MIQPNRPHLSIVRQCRLVLINRSSFYHRARGESTESLAMMAEIDRQFLDTPFYRAQQMAWHLRAAGGFVNVKRVRRLMRLMGLIPIYQRPRTSISAKGHKIYPYLLRELPIESPIRSGTQTSPTSRWPRDFCIWWRSWTDVVERCWREDFEGRTRAVPR